MEILFSLKVVINALRPITILMTYSLLCVSEGLLHGISSIVLIKVVSTSVLKNGPNIDSVMIVEMKITILAFLWFFGLLLFVLIFLYSDRCVLKIVNLCNQFNFSNSSQSVSEHLKRFLSFHPTGKNCK